MVKTFLFFLSLSFCSVSFSVLQPGLLEPITILNSTNYSIKGFCNVGAGDVTINIGSLVLTTPCFDVAAAYRFTGDVSSETSANPIRQCVDQVPLVSICSEYTDNGLALPNVILDTSPLLLIDENNENSYSISGKCAPVGANLSVDINAEVGIVSGLCESQNSFLIRGDVSSVAVGAGHSVSVNIDDGVNTSSILTSVEKSLGGLDPIPSIINVSTSFVDSDSDTWLESGDTIDFSLEFSEEVNASVSVRLHVGLNSGDVYANYLSGTGTNTLTFRLVVASGDEQCNGKYVLKEIDLNGGFVEDVSGQDADFRSLPKVVAAQKLDAEAPSFDIPVEILSFDATFTYSPEFGGEDFKENESCGTSTLEAAIGETPGGTEVTPYLSVPSSVYDLYRIEDGVDGYAVTLFEAIDYYINLRAFDEAGNLSATHSSVAWQLNPAFEILNLIVYLDASREDAVLDIANRPSDDPIFDGLVQTFVDTSGSAAIHSFSPQSSAQRPSFDAINESLVFDQVDDCLSTPNHADLNLATVDQRSLGVLIKIGADTTNLQMIYEEGAQSRGMNFYIYQDRLYCGFWNLNNDGDGAQSFLGQSAPIVSGEIYNVTSVFDYTNYTSPAGPDGTFTCYIDGAAMGPSLNSTSRLFAHSGDVRLGCNGSSTIVHTGLVSGGRFFGGEVMEFMAFNAPPTAGDVLDIYNFLQLKWGL